LAFPPSTLWYGPPVLGQAHTPRRRWLGVALAALTVVLVVPAAGGADPSTRADALRAQNATLATRSHSALLGLYSLDTRLASARARLDGLRAQAAELRRERASLAVQLSVARSGIRISQRRLAARLRLLYEQGDVSILEIMLGSKTLDDAITTLDNLNRVASLDADVLAQVRDARRHLNGASAALSERQARLAATTRGAEATAASLEQAKAERTAFVADLSRQRRLNSAQISQLPTEARAAQVRTAALTRAAPDATVAAPAAVAVDAPAAPVSAAVAPPQGGRTITVSATG
jgi:peptidoglycan hydrolase CwlO-like protein